MPVKWKWRLVVALLGVGLMSHPGEAAKIQHFKDDQGTLHICNADEAAPGKAGPETKPAVPKRRRWVYQQPAPTSPASPLSGPQAPAPVAPPASVVLPPPEAAASPVEEAVPPMDEVLAESLEEAAAATEADPNAGQPVSDSGRIRGGGRR